MATSRPKILFCMHMPPPVHGAAMVGQYIHDSEAINSAFECRYINIATASSVDDIGKGGARKLLHILQKRREIINGIRQFHPDVVYITPNAAGGAFYKDYLFVQQIKRMGCKVVMHFHNKGVAADKRKGVERWLYKRFFVGTKVVHLSELLYPDMAAFVPRSNVYICPNGIPDSAEVAEHTDHDIPHVLFLSNLIRAKGVYTLLEACEMLRKKHITFRCDMVGAEGDISANQLLEDIKNCGISEVVTYHGAQLGACKQTFFNRADIFVLPTYNECFPLVILEAMRSGVACVATSEGAIPEMLENGHCGVIVPSRHAEALADAMEQLLANDDMRKKIAANGRQAFEEKYTLQIFEQRMVEILSNVLRQT